jgi:heterodisulfide reductase subunit B
MLSRVNEALAVAGLEYRGGITVRHIVDVLYNDITPEGITSRINTNLGGLKVAPYYGCQLVRPRYGLDDADNPVSLDRLVTCLGAEAVDYPLKTRCCGGSLSISEESRVLGLIHKLLKNAAANGAQCIVTACPLCQTNLDAFQSRARARFGGDYELPVLYITQLIGVALGLQPGELGFSSHVVSPGGVLDFIYNRVNYATTHPVEAEEKV